MPGAARGAVPLAAPPARVDVGGPLSALGAFFPGGFAGTPGGLRLVSLGLGGGLRASGAVSLGDGVQPSAITERPVDDGIGLLVADRAGDRLFVVRGDARHGFSVSGTVGVGHEPVAMTVGDFGAGTLLDVAVADTGDNTVTVLPGKAHGVRRAARLRGRGGAVDIVAEPLDDDINLDLAVADHDARALTILYGDGKGGVLRRSDIALPGHPVAVAALDNGNSFDYPDLSRDDRADLAVTYDDSATVTVLLGGRAGPGPMTTVALPAPGRPTAVVSGTFNAHGRVERRSRRQIQARHAVAQRRPRPSGTPTSYPVAGQPAALAVTDGAGDDRQDVLIADATGAVEDLVPGDRFLLATGNSTAGAVEASGGVIYYTQKIGTDGGTEASQRTCANRAEPTRLAIPPAFFPISVYLGADNAGRTELSYARCHARRRCGPYTFRLPHGPERPIDLRRPAGCQVDTFARWRAMAV